MLGATRVGTYARGALLLGACTVVVITGGRARAADVIFELQASVQRCSCFDIYCWDYFPECSAATSVVLSPPVPAITGTIELDSAGGFLRGALTRESYAIDGIPRSAATEPLWPSTFAVESFVSPFEFSGVLTAVYVLPSVPPENEGWIIETYRFWAPPTAAPPPVCLNLRRHLDADADGQEDSRDLAPLGATDISFGARVDGAGRTIADFCAAAGAGPLASPCRRRDFLNDEPRVKRPRDCALVAEACQAAEPTGPAIVPPFSGPTCQGLALFVDADADGEVDASDRCPGTAAEEAVDEDGCSRRQFCREQRLRECRYADFANDEPGRRKPRDCARVAGSCAPRSSP